MFKEATLKLATMRKARGFSVLQSKGKIMIQSDISIGEFDEVTGEGVFNMKGSYFMHLSAFMGAKPLTLTPEQLSIVKAAAILPGQEIGPGVILAG